VAVILTCRHCSEEHRRENADEDPAVCPSCGVTPSRWKGATIIDEPAVAYDPADLTEREKRILKALWIDPEQPLAALAQD
jgi:RNA polymerase subunit RPABC4/transcription elongation factor Spt4